MNQSSKYFQNTKHRVHWTSTDSLLHSSSITLSTSTGITTRGLPPIVNFTVLPAGLILTHNPGNPAQYILQGATEDVERAMLNLQIQPGYQNGEDILVNITAAALESNPTEQGPDEVAILRVRSVDTFIIPIDPGIEGEPVLTFNGSATSGNEDTTISLGTVRIQVNGTVDADGSEIPFLEVDTRSFPTRTKFYINGTEQAGVVLVDKWLQLRPSGSSSFSVRPPPDFSGELNITFRARIIDYTMTGNVEKMTSSIPLQIRVFPVADGISAPTALTVGIEDLDPVPFGRTLATTTLRASDRGTGAGNNPEAETFQHIVLTLPQDVADLTYSMSGPYVPTSPVAVTGFGSAQVFFNASSRSYNITSTTITNATNIAALTQVQRQTSMSDILKTLESFEVKMGPAHSDKNGQIAVSVTTLDVNLGVARTRNNPFSHQIKILAVADTPSLVVSPVSAIDEDSFLPLKIQAGASADVDGSEFTFVRIVVPLDAKGKVPGRIGGAVPAGVTLTEPMPNVYVITSSSSTVDQRISLLNSFINIGNDERLRFSPSKDWSGKVTLTIQVINYESATADEIAPNQVSRRLSPPHRPSMYVFASFAHLSIRIQSTLVRWCRW